MRAITSSKAKSQLSGLIENVNKTKKEVLITRNGLPVAVLMSVTKFDSWKETLAIKSDASLMRDIKQGLVDLKSKNARLYSLKELFQ
jgi:antitoxin YefM